MKRVVEGGEDFSELQGGRGGAAWVQGAWEKGEVKKEVCVEKFSLDEERQFIMSA